MSTETDHASDIDVGLPRPRAVGAPARLALLEQVEALDLALRSASGR